MSSFTVLNASAGSGKTQRITLEMLRLILPNPSEASRILSITFTNKAAGEMKDRLISSLSDIARTPEKSRMLPALQQAFPQKTTAELSQMADRALKYVLHHYSDIAISTIDSFMQRIIRTFARELQLPANYEVTVGDEELNELIISNIIDNANLNDNITRVLKEIISMQMDNDNSPLRLADELLPLVQHLTQEASVNTVDSALEAGSEKMIKAFDSLLSKNKIIASEIQKKLDEINSILSKENIGEKDFIKKGPSKTIFEYIMSLNASFNTKELSKTMMKILDSGQFLVNPRPEIESRIQTLLYEIIELISEYKYGRMMAKRFPVVALLSEIWKFREEYKSEKNILPVSDFNRIIREVLSKEPVPFIYLRAGSRYKTIMIDEFQDTSLMQWLNLLPLIHESLARGNSSWVVGDPKQSIYRWRNGKVEIMLGLPEIFEGSDDTLEAESIIKSAFQKEDMEYNYRSDVNIVDFNSQFYEFTKNRFITSLSEEEEEVSDPIKKKLDIYSGVYDQIEQKPNAAAAGFIECRIYKGKLNDHKKQWLEDIVEIIRKCIDLKYNLSDIAILTRQNNIGIAISSYLMSLKEAIPVISRETLQFCTSPHSRLAMCMYRLLHCPGDDLNATETWLLLQQYANIDFEDDKEINNFLIQKKNVRGIMLLNYLTQKFDALNPESIVFMPPADQLDIIIHTLGISDTGGFFLLFLREAIMKQQDKTGYNADMLWQWWTEKGKTTSVLVPDASDAVNIMTIHSSKGLQWPIVIMPYFNIDETKSINRNLFWHETNEKQWGIPYSVVTYTKDSPGKDIREQYQIEKTKSLMDTINLMYVGTTRPEEKLFLFSFLTPDKTTKESNKSKKKEPTNKTTTQTNSANFLQDFIRCSSIQFAETTHENHTSWTLGNFAGKREPKEKKGIHFNVNTFRVNPNKPLDSLRKSKTGFDSAELRESAMKGKIIHELLSGITEASDITHVIDNYTRNGWIENEMKEKYIQLVNVIVEKFSFAFPGRKFVMSEREIADKDGIVWRPDRMIFDHENKWKVIDFKTGREKKEHRDQVQHYSNLLIEAGIKVESSHLIYIDTEKFEARAVEV
jgi:ATP-dependent exoDNAse (exonuclease V) beta subunit